MCRPACSLPCSRRYRPRRAPATHSTSATIPCASTSTSGRRRAVARHPEEQSPVVREDRDRDSHAVGDGDEGAVLEHLATEAVERELRSRDVGGDRADRALRDASHHAGARTRDGADDHRWGEVADGDDGLAGLGHVRALAVGHAHLHLDEAVDRVGDTRRAGRRGSPRHGCRARPARRYLGSTPAPATGRWRSPGRHHGSRAVDGSHRIPRRARRRSPCRRALAPPP